MPVDADGDGYAAVSAGGTDCDDERAFVHPDATEMCENGVDDDCDGLLDCGDPSCDRFSACAEDCTNGVDDDGDGLVDCEDGGCADFERCSEDCGNGVDDDEDGLVDCSDDDCAWREPCAHRTEVRLRLNRVGVDWRKSLSSGGCALEYQVASGSLVDLEAGDACAFTGGRMSWAAGGFGAATQCSWRTLDGDGGWDDLPRLSDSCGIIVQMARLAPSSATRPMRRGHDVGDEFSLELRRRVSPGWTAVGRFEVTRAGSTEVTSGYGTLQAWWLDLTLVSPMSWTVPVWRRADPP